MPSLLPKRLSSALCTTALTILVITPLCGSAAPGDELEILKANFANPPADTRPGCYWYWINDNISTPGLTKDLEAMAAVGIGRAYIGHIYDRQNDNDTPPGDVKFMTPEWWQAVQHAVKEAERFNIDIGFFNSPGWSQSGGHWIRPEESMRYLGHSETVVEGGKQISTTLPVPVIDTYPNYGGSKPIRTGPNFTAENFQDVRVVAYKQPGNSRGRIPADELSVTGDLPGYKNLFDADDNTTAAFTAGSPTTFTLQLPAAIPDQPPVQAILVTPLEFGYDLRANVEVSDDGQTYRHLTTYHEQRGHQGPKNTSKIAIPLGNFTGSHIRLGLQFDGGGAGRTVAVSEISLSDEALLASYARKQLGETSPHTKIPVDAYIWTEQPASTTGTAISSTEVVDLSDKMDAAGNLTWDAPPGRWTILRTGMIPIGTQCAPCSPESRGLEIDKMNREHASAIFEGMVGEFLRRTPPEDRKALKYVIADSYETGPQNWTDGMIEKFEKRFGYSPVQYLPTLTGRIVDSPEISDRFLWDLRQLIVESVAYEYVGGLRDITNRHGLKLWLENYGHWGFISEFLLYGSQTDEVGGEIWESSNPVSNVECRAAASSAHIYGKTDVYAEIFTSGRNFKQSPQSLKPWCDWAFGAGINHAILHVYIHQPDERKPGIIEWFGTAFNRHNTWFAQSKAFNDYMRRGAVMLKAGRPVADVAYYIGEHSPSMDGPMEPALPPGYDFDHINADVLINHARVENGRIVTAGGASYAVLVLPPHKEMRPEVAEAIGRLVHAGATVLGPKPERSPSLQHYPHCDTRLKVLADQIWGEDFDEAQQRAHGKGVIYNNVSLAVVLDKIKVIPDVVMPNLAGLPASVAGNGTVGVHKNGGLIFKHRKANNYDIYFIANTSDVPVQTQASFRQVGRQPFLCNALSGKVIEAAYSEETVGAKLTSQTAVVETEDGEYYKDPDDMEKVMRTSVPLFLDPGDSLYVVFSEPQNTRSGLSTNNVVLKTTATLESPWTVRFDGFGAPAETTFETLTDWTDHLDNTIRYYSGTATYETTFTLQGIPAGKTILDLGNVSIIATVIVNGKEVGTVWTNPWMIDISSQVRAGDNNLQVKVTNTWNNRLAADERLPKDQRQTYVSRPYNVDKKSPLLPSGLLGPVTIMEEVKP